MSSTLTPVKFGTDGWRGVIADDFTYANVRIAAAAIANYVLSAEPTRTGVCIGYDTRFGSPEFAQLCADTLAAAGVPVKLAAGITPTPTLSFAVRQHSAAGGIMITSSHNPPQWNGVKYKAYYGGAGSPGIIAAIETWLDKPLPNAASPAAIEAVDFLPDYIRAVEEFIDLKAIAASKRKFLVDCMYGCGAGIISGIFKRIGVDHVEIRANHDPLFGGVNPEPILPHIHATQLAVVEHKCDAGLITDGDADRVGAVDEHGNFVDPHKIFSILLEWLLEKKKWPGDVTRAFNTTKMIDRICARYGRRLHEHGIGFKYVTDLMLEHEILIGGEESGGIGISRWLPERDGLLNSLLLANVMADENKSLGELVASLQQKYGEHHYARVDMHIPDAVKLDAIKRAKEKVEIIAGMKVLDVQQLDGVKFFLDNPEAKSKPNAAESWLLLRASGTEPLLRVYAESTSPAAVQALLAAGQAFVLESGQHESSR